MKECLGVSCWVQGLGRQMQPSCWRRGHGHGPRLAAAAVGRLVGQCAVLSRKLLLPLAPLLRVALLLLPLPPLLSQALLLLTAGAADRPFCLCLCRCRCRWHRHNRPCLLQPSRHACAPPGHQLAAACHLGRPCGAQLPGAHLAAQLHHCWWAPVQQGAALPRPVRLLLAPLLLLLLLLLLRWRLLCLLAAGQTGTLNGRPPPVPRTAADAA
jgi:hypothetical protein